MRPRAIVRSGTSSLVCATCHFSDSCRWTPRAIDPQNLLPFGRIFLPNLDPRSFEHQGCFIGSGPKPPPFAFRQPPSLHRNQPPSFVSSAPRLPAAALMRPCAIKQRDVAPVQTFAKAAAKCSAEVSWRSRLDPPPPDLTLMLASHFDSCITGAHLRPVRHGQLRKHRAQHVLKGVPRFQGVRSAKGASVCAELGKSSLEDVRQLTT